jgi:Recombination enhancement, RecA-dependent nuclease
MSRLSGVDPKNRRFRELQELGCCACRQMGYIQPCDIHHILSGHKRIGDEATVGLCEYHHRGVWNTRFASLNFAKALCGPSLALEPNAFRERFGTDEQMLAFANEHCTHRRINHDED